MAEYRAGNFSHGEPSRVCGSKVSAGAFTAEGETTDAASSERRADVSGAELSRARVLLATYLPFNFPRVQRTSGVRGSYPALRPAGEPPPPSHLDCTIAIHRAQYVAAVQ